MLLQLPKVLTPGELQAARAIAEAGQFEDGTKTASGYLHGIKHNLQLLPSGAEGERLTNLVLGALKRSRSFRTFAMPRRFMPPRFSRYEAGMAYGPHIDQAFMGLGEPLRSDLSLTLFLSDADSYDGGVLVLETPFGPKEVKLDAGDAVCYATTVHHQVTEVTRGVRLVIILWIQSCVPEPAQRQLLYELDTAKERVREASPGSEEAEILIRVHANLLRMWGRA